MGNIEFGDIGWSQCHKTCERERNTSIVTLWLTNVTQRLSVISVVAKTTTITNTPDSVDAKQIP